MTLRIILFPSKISYNLRTGLAEGDFKLGWIQKNKHGVGVVNMEKMQQAVNGARPGHYIMLRNAIHGSLEASGVTVRRSNATKDAQRRKKHH